MHFSQRKKRRAPAVIIVSLIDVLLVVLIFLMVTTTFRKLEPALQLALPESKEAKLGAAKPATFVVAITTNFPFIYVEGRPLRYDQLQDRLRAAVQKDPKLQVDIKADKLAPVGELIKVIDAAKEANAGSINAITEKPASP